MRLLGSADGVKGSADDVKALIAANGGEPFAPAGRVFRQWVAIPRALSDLWPQHIEDAYAFVLANPSPAKGAKKTAAKKTASS